MRRFLVSVPLALLLTSGTASAETVRIPHEKYVLPNGLTVILHVDPTLPLATVNTWYRVGGKDEPEARSGFAHLFEHLMFMGTHRVPTGQFDLIMEGAGGSNNASTSLDRTNYFSAGPAGLLETLLWLDADRLEALGDAMDTAKLEVQRAVVLAEKKQNYDNAPYGKAELVMHETMYPPGHPYRWAVIGKDEDIRNATVDDVKTFFSTFYVPNNASLVVAGDFDPKVVKPLVERLFGTLPRGGTPPHRKAEPVVLPGLVRKVLKDKVSLPQVSSTWHSPALYAPGDAEMDLIASALAEGNDSRLYKRLVYDEKVAQEVTAYQSSQTLGSLFRIEVLALPGADLDAIERIVDEEVARLAAEGPTEAEVAKARAKIETGTIARLQSLSARADMLNSYEFHFGQPDSVERDLDRYRKATTAGARDWAKKVLDPSRRLVMRVLPEVEADDEASPRAKRPEVRIDAAFAPPRPESFTLPNGLVVQHVERRGVPLVAMGLVLPAGSAGDPEGRGGLASLTAGLLEMGAGDLDAIAFASALESLGTSLGASAERDGTSVSMRVLRDRFDRALGLFTDAVLRPRLEAADFERVKTIRLAELEAEQDDPVELARRSAYEAWFGVDHPYGRSPNGSIASVGRIAADDVRSWHRERFVPKGATLVVAGDISRKDLEAALGKTLGAWKGPEKAASAPPVPARVSKGPAVYLVDRPGAAQTAIRIAMPGIAHRDAARVPLELMNVALGGSFSSRLNTNLRETHGWTYGASSAFATFRDGGCFLAGAAVRADATGPAVKEFLAELKRVKGGDLTDEEATKARTNHRTETVQAFESLEGVMAVQAALAMRGAPSDEIATDAARAAAATAADLNGAAKAGVRPEDAVIVLVGDRAVVLPQLEGLGLPAPRTWKIGVGASDSPAD